MGCVHKNPDFFENRDFFFVFYKIHVNTRKVFESFLLVHTKALKTMKISLTRHVLYDVCHLRIRKPPFSSGPHKNDQPAFSTISSLGTVFENWRFWCTKTPFTCGRKAKTGNKISFSKITGQVLTGPGTCLKCLIGNYLWSLFSGFDASS